MKPKTVGRLLIAMAIIGVITIVVALGADWLGSQEDGLKTNPWILVSGLFGAVLILTTLVGWGAYDNRKLIIWPNSAYVSNTTGKIIQTQMEKITVWKKKHAQLGLTIIPLKAETTTIHMALSPITPNPKVRKLSYKVTVKGLFDDSSKLQLFLNNMLASGLKLCYNLSKHISSIVKFQLYEMNEKNSKELAGFYNPEDKAQQTSFQKCIAKYINPTLEKIGLEVESASFQLG